MEILDKSRASKLLKIEDWWDCVPLVGAGISLVKLVLSFPSTGNVMGSLQTGNDGLSVL